MYQKVYRTLLAPVAKTEDDRRRESILDILLLGSVFLSLAAFIDTVVNTLREPGYYIGTPPLEMFIITSLFIALYAFSRRGFYRPAAYIFIAAFFVFATYPLVVWGIQLPQGILAYSLVIVMAGVLLSSRVSFIITALMAVTLVLLTDLKDSGLLHVDMKWSHYAGSYSDAVVYIVTFTLIALVSWLSNREIERSLVRARHSERELRKERNSLEVKVQERTKQLQQSQVEKMVQLQRFAEFGRLTSTLLHDLANPLTSVSLELEQLADTNHSHLVREARKSTASMERYLNAARRQLRNQSEIRLFNVAEEIDQVMSFIESKAKKQQVRVETKLDDELELYGDSIRFNQILSNLVANAIDAYDGIKPKNRRVIVTAKSTPGAVVITVQDFACGMDKKELTRIFEAFYTTKPLDRGSGLGLSITKRTVEEDFSGEISVTSVKDKGTCFTVKLPTK